LNRKPIYSSINYKSVKQKPINKQYEYTKNVQNSKNRNMKHKKIQASFNKDPKSVINNTSEVNIINTDTYGIVQRTPSLRNSIKINPEKFEDKHIEEEDSRYKPTQCINIDTKNRNLFLVNENNCRSLRNKDPKSLIRRGHPIEIEFDKSLKPINNFNKTEIKDDSLQRTKREKNLSQ